MSYPTDDEIRAAHGINASSIRIIKDANGKRPNAFQEFSRINRARAERWHRTGIEEWSHSDWATALAGEVGEVCNAVKKFNRLRDSIPAGDGDTPQPDTVVAATKAVAKEIGDVYAYLDLLAQRFGLDTFTCIRETFNQISVREKMPERIREDL